jgi:YVTN family beta-propeller protein
VDANSDEVINTIRVGARPWDIAIYPDGKYFYEADVSVVDLDSEKEISHVNAGEGPWGVVVVPQSEDA